MSSSRRKFLKRLQQGGLGFGSLLATSTFRPSHLHANSANDYKALVCVFLFGGMDNHDTILPYDNTSYQSYSEIRSSLLQGYTTRQHQNLLELQADNLDHFQGRRFALPTELSGIHQIFSQGDAAILGNVVPLLQPLNRHQWEQGTVPSPKRLFSHNDQQSTWMSSEPEGATLGWGGRFSDVAFKTSTINPFSNITTFNSQLFLNGQVAEPYHVSLNNSSGINILEDYKEHLDDTSYQKMLRHFYPKGFQSDHILNRDVSNKMIKSYELNQQYGSILKASQPLSTTFPTHHLGQQLKRVAETIAVRSQLADQRQIFFVGMGGFDTHSQQAKDMPKLQSQIDTAITAFYNEMQVQALGEKVTLFTASDFGQSLVINEDGTDHGWGAHHFILGGAVQGKNIYGSIPEYRLGHEHDSGHGRLIPSVSVEQYAASLGKWFGLSDPDLNAALPNLVSFQSQEPLSFI